MKKRILHTDFNIAKYLFKSLFRDRSRGAGAKKAYYCPGFTK